MTSSAENADCAGEGTPTMVDVENIPLTDFTGTLTAQVPGATNSTIECVDDQGNPIGDSGPFADPATLVIDPWSVLGGEPRAWDTPSRALRCPLSRTTYDNAGASMS